MKTAICLIAALFITLAAFPAYSQEKQPEDSILMIDFYALTKEERQIVCKILSKMYKDMTEEEKRDFLRKNPTFKNDFTEFCWNKK